MRAHLPPFFKLIFRQIKLLEEISFWRSVFFRCFLPKLLLQSPFFNSINTFFILTLLFYLKKNFVFSYFPLFLHIFHNEKTFSTQRYLLFLINSFECNIHLLLFAPSPFKPFGLIFCHLKLFLWQFSLHFV